MYNSLRGALLEIILCWRRKNYEHCGFISGMYFTRKFATPVVETPAERLITI
jgi:hypothetical protein